MSSQNVLKDAASAVDKTAESSHEAPALPQAIPAPSFTLPEGFRFDKADPNLLGKPHLLGKTVATSFKAADDTAAPLGVLSNFKGTFAGRGFNLIFRPNSAAPTTTTFPNPISPPAPTPPSENVLELNLTTETLTFSTPLGSVPNRGLEAQNDIFLNGVPYLQVINDVSNVATGKADGPPIAIHFEPGLWMHVPATKNDPILGETLTRMASIPHGTTINAQGLAPAQSFPGPPRFDPVDITPFPVGSPATKIRFQAQDATNVNTPRLPQDLSKFIAAGTITQAILDDPNTILRNANVGKTILNTTVIKVSTQPDALPTVTGQDDGTSNIAFLQGTDGNQANANAASMTATFWVNTVQHKINVPIFKPGQPPLHLPAIAPRPGARVPIFEIHPPHEIKTPRTITVNVTEIQYSQVVFLNFAGLTWPHVSVATLIPSAPQPVPPSAWN